MSEEAFIRHCAPTLAGIKTGNLFNCPYADRKALLATIRSTNRKLRAKGLCATVLRSSKDHALIYLYRPGRLSADLENAQATALLKARGYDPGNCGQCVAQLTRNLRNNSEFPHEIGLFLGYPAEDVQGFIENCAKNCKCVGCWKVYGDEEAARKRFTQYQKCTRVYQAQWAKGTDIERLTVAG